MEGSHAVRGDFFIWPWSAMLYPAVLFPIGLTLLCAFVWRATAISRLAVAGSAQWHPVREALDVGLDDDIVVRVSTIFS